MPKPRIPSAKQKASAKFGFKREEIAKPKGTKGKAKGFNFKNLAKGK